MKRAVKKNTGIYNIFGALIVLALVGLSIVVVNVLKNKNDTYVIPAGSTVYDINNEQANSYANTYGIDIVAKDIDDLFTSVEAVYIATPNITHYNFNHNNCICQTEFAQKM